MANSTTLRININSGSAFRLASLVSNSVILIANAFLVGSGFRQQLHNRQRERIASNLQLAADVAAATASLAKIITDTIEQHHDQDR